MEVGLTGDIFSQDANIVADFMTESWVKNTLKFITENSIDIESSVGQLRLWQEEDSY